MSTIDGEASRRPLRQRRSDPFCWAVMAAMYGSGPATQAFGASWPRCPNPPMCELQALCERLLARAYAVTRARRAIRLMRAGRT